MGIPRIGNLGGANYGIWWWSIGHWGKIYRNSHGNTESVTWGGRITVSGGGKLDIGGRSIGIAMGIPRIGNLGGGITVSGSGNLKGNL